MFDYAILSDRQHEQFHSPRGRLALRESAATGAWAVAGEAEASLIMAIENNSLVIERAEPNTLATADGQPLDEGQSVPLPCAVKLGEAWLGAAARHASRPLVQLNEAAVHDSFDQHSNTSTHAGPSAATVTRWLADTAKLHRASADSTEFYTDAARFAVETASLDGAWILRRTDTDDHTAWHIAGSHLPEPEHGLCFDPGVLTKLEAHPTTWYQPADEIEAASGKQAVVVSPVLDEGNHLVGAVYAVRNISDSNRRRGIRPLEARLIQLLADSVAVGIARLQRETEAARTRVLLEHAFSPNLAEYIQQHPQSLTGQQRHVTLMFADLRGYSTLAESLQLTDCYELLGDVMETLTQVVVRQRGIVVDYYGDGLLALWNAPVDQPNHADLACQSALEMFESLDPVNQRWAHKLDNPLELGIGIHSGPAYVGNAGTRSRLKYGARGNTVNVASRVQAASKQLQLPLVITAATQQQLSSSFFTLRVCTAKLPGLEQPAQLFTAYPSAEASQVRARLDEYSRALELFEAGELEAAEQLLSDLSRLGPATPAQFLAHYAALQQQRQQGRRAVDRLATQHGPVIEILSK